MQQFTAATRQWFQAAFDSPTPVQQRGWERIAAGEHALLLAPTGSGKTLAAFLWGIDRVLRLPADAPAGVRVLYVSPLKALAYDVERNLRAPLVGTLRAAEQQGVGVRPMRVDVRTGDTPAADRRRQLRDPGDILVTTPESLFLLMAGQAAATLMHVHTIIVDEIHALAPTKRGVHLTLTLERLTAMLPQEPQRIGLSATVQPHAEAARFLAGARPVAVVDATAPPFLDLTIAVPVPDMEKPPTAAMALPEGGAILAQIMADETRRPRDPGMMAAMYPLLLELIQSHRSTIVFVNSRTLCERLAQRINELAEVDLCRAHHGSLAQNKRAEIEEQLKAGSLRALVATSSLELGIDMGAVDLVVLVESPGSVARGLQRVGRAGHAVGQRSQGVMLPKFRGDLLECAVVSERMRQGLLEPLQVPQNALDVLAQHLVAMCLSGPQSVDALLAIVNRAYAYMHLSRQMLVAVLEMLSGTYPSDEFNDLRPYLSWDRSIDQVSARKGARLVSVLNAGTIPDRGLFTVHLGEDGPRVGELDEEMVFESRRGDTFMLGASTWRVEAITRDRVIVSPAPGEPGRMPFWRGDGPGRPIALGYAMGAFVRRMDALSADRAQASLRDDMQLDAHAASNLINYLREQRDQTGTVPTDKAITIERFRDEMGDWRICILSAFGARVHAPWAMAIEALLGDKTGLAVQTMYTDDGIVLRFANADEPPDLALLLPEAADVEELVMQQLGQSALFASIFRENAGRALLLPRRLGEKRTPLWTQRLKSNMLLAAAQRYPSFPLVLETYRHCLRDIFDVPALAELLRAIQRRDIVLEEVETNKPSPFARSLVFAYVAAYLYAAEAPSAERRAQALTLDRDLLGELLGQAQLRELLDAAVMDAVEADLQATAPDRQARDKDALHDILRRVGDLRENEVLQRCAVPPAEAQAWLAALRDERRAAQVKMVGELRWIAIEDVARYRDALGVVPPSGLPERFLAATAAPLESLVRRYAHRHGPFIAARVAERLGLLPAQVLPVLQNLEHAGTLFYGEMRPGGTEPEWCDADVLRRIKRDTVAKLRREVAAVDKQALAQFVPRWHGLGEPRRGAAALEEAIAQLEGLALPWSAWSTVLLAARVAEFRVDMLDMLCATGAIVWVGCGSLGSHDGRIMLLRRPQAALLLETPPPYEAPTPAHTTVLEHLARRGACFTVELSQVTGISALKELDTILWDLVWAGLITNDTLQPLRALGQKPARPTPHRRPNMKQAPVFGGRWWRVQDLTDPAVQPTQQAYARASMLLSRYGIVSRECAAAEDLTGGFASVYGVLKAMEDTGKVRRGYFAEGLAGAQFGYAGAIERLRGQRQDDSDAPRRPTDVIIICAVDPANVYGTLLDWPAASPSDPPARPRRVSGAWVVLAAGELLVYVEANGHGIITYPAMWESEQALAQAVSGLRMIAQRRRGQVLYVRRIDGAVALGSKHTTTLQKAGLTVTFDGLVVEANHA